MGEARPRRGPENNSSVGGKQRRHKNSKQQQQQAAAASDYCAPASNSEPTAAAADAAEGGSGAVWFEGSGSPAAAAACVSEEGEPTAGAAGAGSELFAAAPFAAWGFLHVRLRRSLVHHGFVIPTKIQLVAIPTLLHGHDALIQCPTGLGKTLCLAVPLLQRILRISQQQFLQRKDGTRGIVLLPTRELALQATETISRVAQLFPWLTVSAITGKLLLLLLLLLLLRKREKHRLRGGTAIVVATPGRLLDHLSSTASLRLLPLLFVLLDEADRLLDLGFETKVRNVYDACRRKIGEEREAMRLQQRARLEWQQQQQQEREGETAVDSDAGEQQQLRTMRQQERMHSSGSSSSKESPFQVAMASATLTPSVERLAAFCLRQSPQWVSLSCAEAAETRMQQVQQLLQRKQQQQRQEEPLSEELEAKILKRLCRCSMHAAATNNNSSSSSGDGIPKFDVPVQLQQYYLVVKPRLRLLPLLSFLLTAEVRRRKLVVFVSSCDHVDYLYQLLLRLRWPALLQHNRRQRQRLLQQQQLMKQLQLQQHEQQQQLSKIEAAIKQQHKRSSSKPHSPAAAAKAAAAAAEDEQEERDELADDDLGDEASGLWGGFVLETLNVFKLHGKMERNDRIGCMTEFTKLSGEGAVLLSTDVAARGLNLPEVDWIIQLEPPQQLEEYIHRIGRTARLGREGRALLFLLDSERGTRKPSRGLKLQELSLPRLCESLLRLAPPGLGLVDVKRSSRSSSSSSSSGEMSAHQEAALRFLVRQFCEFVRPRQRLMAAARRAFFSSVRAYKTHSKNLRTIFDSSKLPLGPLASSFCIKETPKEIAGRMQPAPYQQQHQQQRRERGKRKRDEETGPDKQRRLPRSSSKQQQHKARSNRNKDSHEHDVQQVEVVPITSSISSTSGAAARAVEILRSSGELLQQSSSKKKRPPTVKRRKTGGR
ncbi:hypothetical protein Esti_005699 [Eimeria stiedai]